jgi:hypothetical protein
MDGVALEPERSPMSIYNLFVWLGETAPGVFLRKSTAAFAATESVHLLSLAVLGGVVLILDLAALRLLLRRTPIADVARGLAPVFITSLTTIALSGVALVAAGPLKYYTNPLFPVKLGVLAVALAIHLVLQRSLARSKSDSAPVGLRVLAGVSLLLWTSVIVIGRWLGLI